MRRFKKVIFLGGGKFSEELCKDLKARLDEGLMRLGGLQQPPHSNSYAEAMANQEHSRHETRELFDIVRDLGKALTGLEWESIGEVPALKRQLPCEHVWKIDGQHSNEYCGKCFTSKPK